MACRYPSMEGVLYQFPERNGFQKYVITGPGALLLVLIGWSNVRFWTALNWFEIDDISQALIAGSE